MRSHVFLTPMSPDGKPGEAVELQCNDAGPRQFVEPVSPWAVNEKQLGDLRTAVTEAEAALRHAKARRAGSTEIKRLDKAFTSAKRELDTVEYELKRKRQREQVGADSPFARQKAAPTQPAKNAQAAWDKHLRELDAKLAARLAAETNVVCCSGQYLCSTCQATKAAVA